MEKLFGPDEGSHVVLYTTEPLRTLCSFAMHLEYYEVLPKTSSLFLQTIAITHHLVNLVTIPSEEACFSMLRGDYGTKGRKIQPNTEKFLEKTE